MNWRFVFSGLQSASWTIIVVCAIAFAATMFVLLRKYEARLVRPAVSRILLTLRLLVLGLLVAVLLQPILTKSWDIEGTRNGGRSRTLVFGEATNRELKSFAI